MNRLVTERLTLHPPANEDFADLLALWSDPQVLLHIGPPSRREEVWARLLKYVGHWSLFGFGYWMVRESSSGRFAGEVGIAYQRRSDSGLGDPEAGWVFASWAQGRGYASEALGAILDWADARFDWPRINCLVSPENDPSTRLAERNGFKSRGETLLAGKPVVLLQRTQP